MGWPVPNVWGAAAGVADQVGGVVQGVADHVGDMVQGNDATPTVDARGYNGLKSDAKHDFTKWPWANMPEPGVARGVNRRALCICCEYPGKSYRLGGTSRDQETLVDKLAEMTYEVHYLTDQTSTPLIECKHRQNVKLWSNGKHAPYLNGKDRPDGRMHPTKQNILNELEDLCTWLSEEPGRMGWVTYSGHGVNIKVNGDKHELDEFDEAMAPCDFQTLCDNNDPDGGMIRDDTLKQTVKFKSGVVEGTILDLPFALIEKAHVSPEYDPAYYTSYDDGNGMGLIFCISAAKDDQSAFETDKGGICTCAFLSKYSKKDGPANVLVKMQQYADELGMKQTICMHSNREFTEEDSLIVSSAGNTRSLTPIVSAETTTLAKQKKGSKHALMKLLPSFVKRGSVPKTKINTSDCDDFPHAEYNALKASIRTLGSKSQQTGKTASTNEEVKACFAALNKKLNFKG